MKIIDQVYKAGLLGKPVPKFAGSDSKLKEGHSKGKSEYEKAQKNMWVPVGDRLPSVHEQVLVKIRRKRIGESSIEVHVGHLIHDGGNWIIGNQFGFDMGTVISWRPVPIH